MSPLFVAQLWRYPVKSMRGQPLQRAEIRADGIVGDRLVQVRDDRRLLTARTRPALLGLAGTLGRSEVAGVDGEPWWDARALAAVRRAAGPRARLVPSPRSERFDVLPLLVATDGAITAFGREGRRLRPNIVIGGVKGLAERDWEGRVLVIGSVRILLHSLRARCVMTTFDPDTLEQDVDVLRDIRRLFEGTLALNSAVIAPGTVSVNDRAAVVELGEGRRRVLADAGLIPAEASP